MLPVVRVFVSYSRRDAEYLEPTSLIGFLRGLEREGVEIWTDRHLVAGELADEVTRRRVAEADIVLALVSQSFLDSAYCMDVEVREALARSAVLIPVILSPCEWQRHAWLRSRQFLPGGDQTIEEHFRDASSRQRLFLQIRDHLRQQVERARSGRGPGALPGREEGGGNPFGQTLAIRDPTLFVGRRSEMRRLDALLERGSVALIGEPKIGKSSLLWHLSLTRPEEAVGPIDFEAVEGLDDFYQDLASRLGVASADWRSLRDHLRRRPTLLLLDELDKAPGRGFSGEILARLRALSSQSPGFRVASASRLALKRVFPDEGFGSPAYNFLQPLGLGNLPEEEALALLEHPWAPAARPFDPATLSELLSVAGRHPFRLQRAAFHRYEALLDPAYPWQDRWREDMEHML